jgi:hypothetical protein
MVGRQARQRGVAAVEFAICGIIFFMLVFGIIELARAMYICNTLQEVTRRAASFAANTNFSNPTAMQRLRERAIFRESPGLLMLADPISDEHIKIDYLSLPVSATVPIAFAGGLPANPEQNRENCMTDPNGAQCIRLVRVRICMPESNDCDAVPYKTLVSFIPLPFGLPISTTVVHAETLGLPPRLPPG